MRLTRIRDWWWAGFAFAYPLLFAPWAWSRPSAYQVHIGFTAIAVVGALALGWWTGRRTPLQDQVRRLAMLLRRPPLLVGLGLVIWIIVSAIASPAPGIALTGSLTELSNGAYEYALLYVVFVMVYAQVRANAAVARRIGLAVMGSGAVLGVGALVEVLLQHALFRGVAGAGLPILTFPQKGHLAGMLALSMGVAVSAGGVWLVLLIAVGIGLTLNRSAPLAVIPALFLTRPKRVGRVALTVLAVVAGVGCGVWLAKSAVTGPTKTIVSGGTLLSRSYLWRAAIRGIEARPVVGWGGGVFEQYWTDFLSRAELSTYVHEEWGVGPVLKVTRPPGGYPVLVVRAPPATGGGSKVRIMPIFAWHSHNQFLEVGLMSGLVGLVLYLVLLAFGLRGLFQGNPLSLGLLSYFVFLQLWFVIPETRGVLWVVWAAAAASSVRQNGSVDQLGENEASGSLRPTT